MYFFILNGFKFEYKNSVFALYTQPKLIKADLNLSYENSLIEESSGSTATATNWVRGKLSVIELQKPFDLYSLEMFLIYLPIKNANFKWFMRITEELKT